MLGWEPMWTFVVELEDGTRWRVGNLERWSEARDLAVKWEAEHGPNTARVMTRQELAVTESHRRRRARRRDAPNGLRGPELRTIEIAPHLVERLEARGVTRAELEDDLIRFLNRIEHRDKVA